jgi:hypothetical protein
LEDFSEARLNHSCGVSNWHWYFCREACQGVRDVLALGGPDVGAITSVGIQGWANVPPINAVGGSRLAQRAGFAWTMTLIPGGR